MKKQLSLLLCAVFVASALVSCAEKPTSSGSANDSKPSTPASTSESLPPPPPPYEANVLTGQEKDSTYPEGQRITAVMVNNVSECRPQRGLSQAEMIFEIKVEGGITRFMALYNDYNTIPEVGPVRSARDQFFKAVLPFQPLYVHVGESVVQRQLIADYDYQELNLDADRGGIIFRDQGRLSAGFKYEHTAYATGDLIKEFTNKKEVDDQRSYKSTFFEFVNYNEPQRVLANEGAGFVDITHSNSYHTYFEYDESMQRYTMSQWNGYKKKKEATVDENNGVQLGFENLVVLYAPISTYPGHDATNLQYVDYDFGGGGYYFNGGRYEKIKWLKGNSPLSPIRLVDLDGNEISVQINPGRTYVAIVDLDEYEKTKYYNGENHVAPSSIAAESKFEESDD